MATIRFTADRVTAFQCETGKIQSILWDAKTPGLGLRASYGGSKKYVFETRLNGKTLRLVIGDVRTWSVAQAQAEATQLKALADKGIDPRQQKEEQQIKRTAAQAEARRLDLTVAEVWAVYLDDRQPRWGERHYQV